MTLTQAKKKIEKQVCKIREAQQELAYIIDDVLDGLGEDCNSDVAQILDQIRELLL